MPNDTLTLALDGEVTLANFAGGMRHLQELIEALSRQIAGDIEVEWTVDELQASSAITTIRGTSSQADVVERVVMAYGEVGRALEHNQPIPYGDEARKHAHGLAGLLDAGITSVRFETAFGEAVLANWVVAGAAPPKIIYAYGAVKGTVETLTKRRGLRFTLYDQIFDKAISCYLGEDQEDQMRDAWDRRVLVAGKVGREPSHGRAVVVREITRIEILNDPELGSYRRARGVWQRSAGADLPEEVIRRLRDADSADTDLLG